MYVKLLIDVSESTAERVPILLPIGEFSAIVLEVKPISVGAIFKSLTLTTRALLNV